MSKVRKTTLTAILLLVLVVSLFAGCAGTTSVEKDTSTKNVNESSTTTSTTTPEANKGPVTLKVMMHGSTDLVANYLDSLFTAFPDYKDKVKFEYVLSGKNSPEVAQKFRLTLASGKDIPDIVQMSSMQMVEFANAGQLLDISADVEKYKSDIVEGAARAMAYNGKDYAYPQMVTTKVWYYRKDIFDACGIDPQTVKNMNDYLALGDKITAKYPGTFIANAGTSADTLIFGLILSNYDVKAVENGKYVIGSDPGVRKAFELYKQMNDSKYCFRGNFWTPDTDKAFADEKIVSVLNCSWFNEHIPNFAPKQAGKWAATLWPDEIRNGSQVGAGLFVIPSAAPNKEVARDVLNKWTFTKEGNLEVYKKLKRVPILKSAAADPVTRANDPYLIGTTHFDTCFKALDYFKVYPFTPKSSIEDEILMNTLTDYCSGKLTIDVAMKTLEDTMNTQIGDPFK